MAIAAVMTEINDISGRVINSHNDDHDGGDDDLFAGFLGVSAVVGAGGSGGCDGVAASNDPPCRPAVLEVYGDCGPTPCC